MQNPPFESAQFGVFTGLCSHHHYPVPEHSVTPERSPVPVSSRSQAPATAVLLLVSAVIIGFCRQLLTVPDKMPPKRMKPNAAFSQSLRSKSQTQGF